VTGENARHYISAGLHFGLPRESAVNSRGPHSKAEAERWVCAEHGQGHSPKKWTNSDLEQRASACEADVMPVHHVLT